MSEETLTSCSSVRSFKWDNHPYLLGELFKNFYETKKFSDIEIQCEDKSFKTHKVLLAACSGYFNQYLNEETSNIKTFLFGIKSEIFDYILKYMYFGEVDVPDENIDDFLHAANLLRIHELYEITSAINNQEFNSNEQDPLFQESSNSKDSTVGDEINAINDQILALDNSTSSKNGIKKEPNNSSMKREKRPRKCAQASALLVPIPSIPKKRATRKNSNFSISSVSSSSDGSCVSKNSSKLYTSFELSSLKCKKCLKVFKHPESLSHHKKLHRGETKCNICNVTLCRKYNLKMHMKARHAFDQ